MGRKDIKPKKEKELKKNKDIEIRKHICQEVGDINTAHLAMGHIITYNPIMHDTDENKKEYLKRLNSYIKAGEWHRRKFENAELQAYEKIVLKASKTVAPHNISFYKYYILFDMMHILAYELKSADIEKVTIVKERYCRDFGDYPDKKIVDCIFKEFWKGGKKIKQLINEPGLVEEKEYIRLIVNNISFRKKEPVGVMVTATMSAGKSTFINALAGKYICLSQSLACTSKIHCIVNKAFEDGFSYEYDHELVLTAGKEELLHDNELNSSDKIVVSTNFTGTLSRQRMIINDSPGVNYSVNREHKLITERMIKRKNYHLLIYVMNATQLATNDESEHLDYIKKTVGRTPVMFVINKIDAFDADEEDVKAVVEEQVAFLKKKGFKNPMVCPVSSKAGYLAKKYTNGCLSKSEEREFYNYIDKFEKMDIKEYYAKAFKKIKVEDAENEEVQLLKTSGLAYVEKIMIALIKGGDVNGTDIR